MKSKKSSLIQKIFLIIVILLFIGTGLTLYYKFYNKPSPTPIPSPKPTKASTNDFNNKEIKIGINSRPSRILFFAVNHYLSQKGIKLKPVIIKNPNESWLRMKAGELDLNFSTIPEFVLASSRYKPGKIIAFTSTSNGSDGILTKKNINDIDSLIGKRIALIPGSTPHFFLIKLLNSKARSTAEVKIIPIQQMQDALNFLKQGDYIDAALLTEPYLSKGQNQNYKIFLSTKNTFTIDEILVASNLSLKKRRKDIQSVINAYFNLVNFINNNPGLAKKLISNRSGVSIEVIEAFFNNNQLKDLQQSKALANSKTLNKMKKIQQVWSIEGIENSNNKINWEDTVDFKFLENSIVVPSSPIFSENPNIIISPTPQDISSPIPIPEFTVTPFTK